MSILSNITRNKSKNYQGQIEIFRRNDESPSLDDLLTNNKNLLLIFKLKNEKDILIFFHKIYKYSYLCH